jgi:lipopolysaccharide/colanic/teichoic acid biosynthesis glycosyltransferase
MQTSAAHLPSQEGEDTGRQSLSGPDLAPVCGDPVQPEPLQVANAVCGQGGAQFTLAVALDPERLADEFRDFDVEVTAALRMALKRALDVALCLAALIVLLPLFVAIAAMIKLNDGGPVFFAQRRVGLRRKTFRMLKFRSMVIGAERLRPRLAARNESDGPVFKMKADPRVTPIGRFIRKYSLDELPQLLNVLSGSMSIVGPRPPVPAEVGRYEPWQCRRFAMRPGLTCFWQVVPERYQISFADWMRLDLKYIDNWSLRLDFDLILRTFRVVFGGTGE